MNAFVAIRYVTFALFLLFAVLTGSFAALNLGYLVGGYVSKPSTVAESLDTYLVALSILNVLFLLPVLAIELCRKGALTSRIWFELVWVSVFFMAYLGGAIAATLLIPSAICHADTMSKMMCMASTGLIAFTWISVSLHLLYFIILLAFTLIRSRREFGTWNSSVIDQPTRQPTIAPVMVTHTYSRSVDGPIGNVHHISFAGASQDDHSPVEEKKFRNGDLAQPTFALNPGLNGPPTFGHAGFGRNGDLESARGRTMTRNTGLNAISQAPVHRGYQFQRHPYRTSDAFEPSSASSAGAEQPQYPSKQAPWLSGEETPSPAVIRTASRAVIAPPSVSLYPVHVVNTGLTTVPAKPNTPTAKSTLTGFLQVKRQPTSQSKTSLPYLNSSRGTSQRTVTSNASHSQSHSIDSFIQESDASSTNTVSDGTHQRNRSDERDNRPRRKRAGHRPPPLNLSGLSNIANAERRK